MRIRMRKLAGTVVLLVLVAVWALLATALAQTVLLSSLNPLMALLYYAAAGLGWVLPAMPVVAWMVRPDPPPR